MGLKVNAFQVITGQQRDFQLSQARLEQAMQETLQQSCVDVTLAQQIRHETLADLQFHYNLVFPAQQGLAVLWSACTRTRTTWPTTARRS